MGSNIGYTFATIGFGAVGAFLGGWPGMQIGMSLGSLFFNTKQEKKIEEDEYTTSETSKLTVVPYILGTDMSNGTLVYSGLGPELMDIRTVAKVTTSSQTYIDIFEKFIMHYYPEGTDPDDIKLPYVDIYPCFADQALINRLYFDGADQWHLYTHLDYYWRYCGYPEVNCPYITYLDYDNTPNSHLGDFSFYKSATATIFGGFFLPLTMFSDDLEGADEVFCPSLRMPKISAEISHKSVKYTTYLGYTDNNPFFHTFADLKGDYTYGRYNHDYWVSGMGYTISMHVPCWYDVHTKTIHAYNWDKEAYPTLNDFAYYLYYNVTAYGDVISRPYNDKLYFFVGRGWDHNNRYGHPRANYPLAYDLYYIDRTDNSFHSIKYNAKVADVTGTTNPDDYGLPPFSPKSMEIIHEKNEFWVFGHEVNDLIFYTDTRTIQQNENNTQTKVYLDLSAYEEGYWTDLDFSSYGVGTCGWASINYGQLGKDQKRIAYQCKEYIVVDPPFEYDINILADKGVSITLDKFHRYECQIVISGGVTSDNKLIISEEPGGGRGAWDCVFRYDSDTCYSLDALTGEPSSGFFTERPMEFGEKIWFCRSTPKYISDPNLSYEFFCILNEENSNFYVPSSLRLHPSMFSQSGFLRFVVYRFDLETGNFIGRDILSSMVKAGYMMYSMKLTYYPVWWLSINGSVNTCRISDQVFFSFLATYVDQGMYPHTYCGYITIHCAVESGYIDTGKCLRRWYPFGAPGKWVGRIPRGTIKVREYNEETEQYDWYWLIVFWYFADNAKSWFDEKNHGTYVFKVHEDESVDDEFSGHECILFRFYMNDDIFESFSYLGSTECAGKNICITDYDQKVFITTNRGEIWQYIPKNTFSSGRKRMIDGFHLKWTRFFPGMDETMSACKYLMSNGQGEFSNYVDLNPHTAIWHLLNNDFLDVSDLTYRYTSTLYDDDNINADVHDQCEELIDSKIYYADQELLLHEPRYQYSRTIDKTTKIVDLLRDILDTCQGILAPCGGQLKLIIPSSDESPVFYFGHHTLRFSNCSISNSTYIYGDFSSVPENYCFGDLVSFVHNNIIYEYVIIAQTSDRLTLHAAHSGFSGIFDISILKDNIKENSFSYWRKSGFNRVNRLKVKYSNRYINYLNDVIHADDHYGIFTEGHINEKTLELYGIKRPTQAGRMALRYLDYDVFINWNCSIQTDLVGMQLCVGDIVGITHDITSWVGKLFRVASIEEVDNDEFKLEMEEYNPYVYHDYGIPFSFGATAGSGYAGTVGAGGDYSNVTLKRAVAYEAADSQTLYFGFYFLGLGENILDGRFSLYVKDDLGKSVLYTTFYTSPITFILEQDLNPDDVVLYYKVGYVSGGTIPDYGYIFIGNEKIYYSGHDAENGILYGLIRESDNTVYTSGTIVTVINENTPSIMYPQSWIGKTKEFVIFYKEIGYTFSLTVSGKVIYPLSPDLLRLSEI